MENLRIILKLSEYRIYTIININFDTVNISNYDINMIVFKQTSHYYILLARKIRTHYFQQLYDPFNVEANP